jgi:hypothetical protein
VHVVLAPGANDVTGHDTTPAEGSATTTEVTVTVPVFLTLNDQAMVSPRSVAPFALTSVTTADFTNDSPGVWVTGVSVLLGGEVTAPPDGDLPPAVAVLETTPASTSAWVITCGPAVHVVLAPGANDVTGHDTTPAEGSATTTEVTVTVPVFVTLNDQAMVSPRSVAPFALTSVTTADLVSPSPGVWDTGVSVLLGGEVTAPPDGDLPPAVAVLETTPASTSAWVIT